MSVLELGLISMLKAIEDLARIGAVVSGTAREIRVPALLERTLIAGIQSPVERLLRSRIAQDLQTRVLCFTSETSICEIDVFENYFLAGEFDTACDFYISASTRLLATDSPHRALGLTQVATSRFPDIRSKKSAALLIRDVLFSSGQYSRLLQDPTWTDLDFNKASPWDRSNAVDVIRMVEIADRGMYLGDYQELCSRGLLIAMSNEVDSKLRVRAAIAVVRSSAMGLPRTIPRSAYETGKSIAREDSESEIERLLLDMYYHTPFGDFSVSKRAAFRISEICTNHSTRTDAVRMLGDAAYALYCAGELEESNSLFEQTKVLAESCNIASRQATAAHNQSMISIALGRWDLATRFANECLVIAERSEDPFLEGLARRNLCRIAMLENKPEEARVQYEYVLNGPEVANHRQWKAFDLALALGLACISKDRESTKRILPHAEAQLDELRGVLGQEFLVSRIVIAQSFNSRTKAKHTLNQYVSVDRREAYPVPQFLSTSLQD